MRHASTLLIFALVLFSASSADSKKRDRKDGPSSSSASEVSASTDSTNSKAAAPSPARTPEPQAKEAHAPKSTRDEMAEPPPKWTPMPALDGNPGLFTLETGEILPKGGFDFSAGVDKISRMPGEITVLRVVPAFGVGLTHWLSAFVQIDANDHIHVDQPGELSLSPLNATNPQFQNTIYNSILPATGFPPAYVEDYPFASRNGGGVGEVDLGLKIGLLSERRGKPFSLSIRNDFYVPTKTGLSDLLVNEVQYGRFNYGIGVEASKTLFHGAILGTLNWAYRFTRDSSFQVTSGGTPTTVTLSLADQMRAGVGLLVFPDKRFQIISEYNGLIYIGRGIQNTSFGARDPVESITGLRLYPWRHLALDMGYRYSLSLTNHLDRNGFVVKLGLGYWPEKPREPDSLTSSCSVDKPSVMEGSNENVVATVNAVDAYGHPLNYTWTTTGGKIEGTGPSARWDSSGVAPGNYTLTAHVDDGTGKTSGCSSSLTVEPKPAPPAPTMGCSADRSTVLVGERVQITATVSDQTGTPLRYRWQSNGGQILGSGATIQFDTSGLSPGTYTVTGRVENAAGGAADCSTGVAVQAPPPPPQASKISECPFSLHSPRVNNVCKRVLDDVALRLQSDSTARVVLVGFADPKEQRAARLAAERADNAKKYLGEKQGVDLTRIDTHSSIGASGERNQNRRLDVVWVPEGATY